MMSHDEPWWAMMSHDEPWSAMMSHEPWRASKGLQVLLSWWSASQHQCAVVEYSHCLKKNSLPRMKKWCLSVSGTLFSERTGKASSFCSDLFSFLTSAKPCHVWTELLFPSRTRRWWEQLPSACNRFQQRNRANSQTALHSQVSVHLASTGLASPTCRCWTFFTPVFKSAAMFVGYPILVNSHKASGLHWIHPMETKCDL